ncbi:MAG: BTAD domain-containing putative transcriptional regulator [Streptosporangiaceae bacterium]
MYRCGRRAEALAVYRHLHVMLVEDPGVEPERLAANAAPSDPRRRPRSGRLRPGRFRRAGLTQQAALSRLRRAASRR